MFIFSGAARYSLIGWTRDPSVVKMPLRVPERLPKWTWPFVRTGLFISVAYGVVAEVLDKAKGYSDQYWLLPLTSTIGFAATALLIGFFVGYPFFVKAMEIGLWISDGVHLPEWSAPIKLLALGLAMVGVFTAVFFGAVYILKAVNVILVDAAMLLAICLCILGILVGAAAFIAGIAAVVVQLVAALTGSNVSDDDLNWTGVAGSCILASLFIFFDRKDAHNALFVPFGCVVYTPQWLPLIGHRVTQWLRRATTD